MDCQKQVKPFEALNSFQESERQRQSLTGEYYPQAFLCVNALLRQVKFLEGQEKHKCFSELYWRCWELFGRQANFSALLAIDWKLYDLQESLVSLLEYSRDLTNSQALGYFSQGFDQLLNSTQLVDGCRAQKVELAQRIFFLIESTTGKERCALVRTLLRVFKYSPQAIQQITSKFGNALLTYLFQNYTHSYEYFLCEALSRYKVADEFILGLCHFIVKSFSMPQHPNFPSQAGFRNSLLRVMAIIEKLYPQYIGIMQKLEQSPSYLQDHYSLKEGLPTQYNEKKHFSTQGLPSSGYCPLQQNLMNSISAQLQSLSLRDQRQNAMQMLIHEFQVMMPCEIIQK